MLHPSGELSYVEQVTLVDVEVEHLLVLGVAIAALVGKWLILDRART